KVEPGINDRAVLGAQRLGQREQETFLVAVMLVAGVRECAGRCHHGKESGYVLRSRQPGLEIGDVAMQLCMPSIDEGCCHDRTASSARDCKNARVVFGVELREGLAVAATDHRDHWVLCL